jgi:hypothetical protein
MYENVKSQARNVKMLISIMASILGPIFRRVSDTFWIDSQRSFVHRAPAI